MTIDERLERLRERHQARSLARIAEIHDRRLSHLEGNDE